MNIRKRKVSIGDTGSDHNLDFSESAHEIESNEMPYYVIVFNKNAKKNTIEWIKDLLHRPNDQSSLGGAELLTRTIVSPEQETIVEIHAETLRLLQAAEMMEITKEDKEGQNMSSLLTNSEKQRIVLHEIMSLQLPVKSYVFGYPSIPLYPGQSIIQVCRDEKIITHIFPVHDEEELKKFKKTFFRFSLKGQHLDEIRNYFGESVAFYFAFLTFYTSALVPPSILGIVQSFLTLDEFFTYIIVSFFKMLWLTLFLELWKRKSNELAFTWGTLKPVSLPQLHPTFRGKTLGQDPVTKHLIPVYPSYLRYLKVYCGSTPISIICLLLCIGVMLIYFDIEYAVIEFTQTFENEWYLFAWILGQIPGIVYSIVVYVMSRLHYKIAKFLTEWENHKTQESYENHLTAKLLVFEFVNNFVSIFYVAFYLHDIEMLQWQIGIMMIVNQFINQCQEVLLPYFIQRIYKFWYKKYERLETVYEKILHEKSLYPYKCTYDDYLELFIQFGYVFLFASVYPLAAVLALVNNVIETWSDAFKLCRICQRPRAQTAKGIGVWIIAFEIIGVLSVITNCALVCLSSQVSSLASSPFTLLFMAVVIEHIIIVMKIGLSYLIADVPKWVKVQIQKRQFESLQALKTERSLNMKEVLKSMKEKEE